MKRLPPDDAGQTSNSREVAGFLCGALISVVLWLALAWLFW